MSDLVNHPDHYGGEDNPYEAIKVIDAWRLGYCLGNAVKYIARAGKKGDRLTDLRKARWYLDHEIALMEAACRAHPAVLVGAEDGRTPCPACLGIGSEIIADTGELAPFKCKPCGGTGRVPIPIVTKDRA